MDHFETAAFRISRTASFSMEKSILFCYIKGRTYDYQISFYYVSPTTV